jgi:hypothetical protein
VCSSLDVSTCLAPIAFSTVRRSVASTTTTTCSDANATKCSRFAARLCLQAVATSRDVSPMLSLRPD